MKPILAVAATILALAPSPCFAYLGLNPVTKESAKELGLEFRTIPLGDTDVRIEMEFPLDGKLKSFSRVDMQMGTDSDKLVRVTLKEDRSKEGRVIVTVDASRDRLDQISLRVVVPGAAAVVHIVSVKDFVAPK